MTIDELEGRSSDWQPIVTALSFTAVIMSLLNIPAMIRGIHEMVTSTPLPNRGRGDAV
ncbi:MAG: hypothetical protein R3B90_08485 [Planctomycetaceae bacterium]